MVVDDCSTDDTPEVLARYGDLIETVRHDINMGFAANVNHGAQLAPDDDDLVFLNNDTIPHEGWLDALVRHGEANPSAGVVGARLLYADGRIQHAGVVFTQEQMSHHIYVGFPGDHRVVSRARRFQVVTGACMWVRRSTWADVGGFDTSYVNSVEDVDLCLRAGEAGWEVHYAPECTVTHLESATRGRNVGELNMNWEIFHQRWGGRIVCDDLNVLVEDGMLTVNYLPGGRVTVEVSPEIGEAVSSLEYRTESALAVAARRWVEAVEAREMLVTQLRREQKIALGVHSVGAVETPLTEGHWTEASRSNASASTRMLMRKVQPLTLRVDADATPAVNVLYEGYSEEHFYGGHAAMAQLAAMLAGRRHRVRLVSVDTAGVPDEATWNRLATDIGVPELSDVTYVDASDRHEPVRVGARDAWVATSWWTMHIAHAAVRELGSTMPLWLQQEWEEVFYPTGSFAAMAREAYRLPHSALVSTLILAEFFEGERRGVHAVAGRESMVFTNALTTVDGGLRDSKTRKSNTLDKRVLVYARRTNRNMSEVALAGLDVAVTRGWLPSNWQVTAVGAVDGDRTRMPLPDGREMVVLPRISPMRYRALLQSHSVGVALQDSPHPGLVPFDMAAAGMIAVTSTWGTTKTAERLRAVSPNVLGIDATPENVAEALRESVMRSGDVKARRAGAQFNWPRHPRQSFTPQVLEFAERVLGL